MDKNTAPPSTKPVKHNSDDCGVIVIKNVRNFPEYEGAYVFQHLIIGVCHQGCVRAEFDTQPVEFCSHDITVLYPKHTLTALEFSDDFAASVIVISEAFLTSLHHRSSYHYQLEYQKHPSFTLNDEQYKIIMGAMDMIEAITNLSSPHRNAMLADALDVFSRLIDEYRFRGKEVEEWDKNEKLFYRFYDAITQHFQESHEIKFYADLLCLTPKYFATLIKQETGKCASDWIADYLIIQAKILLRSRNNLNIQQITDRLGFPEQSSFSRYFKQKTGLSPREYRNMYNS